ncbi:M57 family metalloprotease [Hymenobacter terrenus]|uniref:M57 family metalloprotease n=1 Tax=Hymenobacter terrenus TaxID=1629124 RepID=UPI001E6180A3|nr:M57 family metalloprotease [Hymenobacter terrenus]
MGLSSCSKQEAEKLEVKTDISQEVLSQIRQLGFSTQEVRRQGDDYVVENDIRLTAQDLASASTSERHLLRVGTSEQYRTSNLVTGLPRVISVSVSSGLPASYVKALDAMILNYNNLKLRVTFKRVTSGANISIVKGPGPYGGYYGEAQGPSNGNPGGTIWLNPTNIGASSSQAAIAFTMAHEVGHCIGFRHTDYADRSYSCPGGPSNEGWAGVGAIHIPGTPTQANANSWMLACWGTNQVRPFTANDKTALEYLY